MKRTTRLLYSALLTLILTFSLVAPAYAFEPLADDNVTVPAGQVINDDLYATGETVTIDGTVKGDLIAAGGTIVINGTIEGDVLAAGAEIIINGTVGDDVRAAGAAITLGENASVGGDIVAAGASFESKFGSTIGGDLVLADGQNLLAGNVAGDALIATSALELQGTIGGDVNLHLGVSEDEEDTEGIPSMAFGPQGRQIDLPTVKSGFTLGESAKIGGKLTYTSNKEFAIPTGVVAGAVNRIKLELDDSSVVKQPSQTDLALEQVFEVLRSIASIILLGLLLAWLFPALLPNLNEKIRSKPWPVAYSGLLAFAAYIFALIFLVIATVAGAVVFGIISLGGLSGLIVAIGLFAFGLLIFAFVLVTGWLAQIMVSQLIGQLIFARLNPALAEHKFWPLALGAVLLSIVLSVPFLGDSTSFLLSLAVLGALWIWVQEWRAARALSAA